MLPQATLMVVFNQRDQVLLLKRSPDHKLFPNEWCLPGGKVDMIDSDKRLFDAWKLCKATIPPFDPSYVWSYKETPDESIFRECTEELDLKIYNFKNTGITMMDSHYHMHVFEALKRYDSPGEGRVFPNREHVKYQFFNIDDLPEELGQCTHEFLTEYYFNHQFETV